MWHVLNKRLIGKLLRTIGNVLCGISWWGGHNWWACCWSWVHHGTLMMLVLPLLGHIWYCRKRWLSVRKQHLWGTKFKNVVHKTEHDLTSLVPCYTTSTSALWDVFLSRVLLLRFKYWLPTPSFDISDSAFRC